MGLRQLGNKVIGYGQRATRLGMKTAGTISRIGKKHVPLAKALLGLAGELGGSNKYVSKAVKAGNMGLAGVGHATAIADRVVALGQGSAGQGGLVDQHKRAYHSFVKGGDHIQAINLIRDDVKKAGVVRSQVRTHANRALEKAKSMRSKGYGGDKSKNQFTG